MFDTGACSTLIEQEFLDSKDIEVKHVRTQAVPIFAASETIIDNQGDIEVTIKVGDRSREQKLIVIKGVKLPTPMILGRDYMQRHDIDLKLRSIEGRSYVELRIGGNAVFLEPRVDNNVTIMTWDPKVLNNTDVQRENKDVSTAEVKRESERMSAKDEDTMSESWSVQHAEHVKASAVEPVKIVSATAGYITLTTPITGHKEALLEPCVGNPQARILCPGVVSLYEVEGDKKYLFTVQYINVEQESIEIDDGKTIGDVQPCEKKIYTPDSHHKMVNVVHKEGIPTDTQEKNQVTNVIKEIKIR